MYGKIINQMNEVIERLANRTPEEKAADDRDAEIMIDTLEVRAHWAYESIMKNHADRQWRRYAG